ncbi:hypothetical protein JOC77_002534 [Peribacillus deserti]|uniref:Uncharacterized protein n=1 Tax=Peribacillus deserti TaxID=673318 RepID=A0ABS2QIW6_9BACI|nr:hypothetical protein [Peribacillus deserti]MBM7693095.1 hypothetical protein [Peribacillus deserti]
MSLSDKGIHKTYHLTDPDPYTVTEIYSLLTHAYLKRKPAGKIPIAAGKAVLPIKPLRKFLGVEKEALDYFTWNGRFDCSQALADLAGSGISCPNFKDGIGSLVEFFSIAGIKFPFVKKFLRKF